MNDKQCPYCKKYIEEEQEICPYCSSKLKKDKHKYLLLILGFILSIVWIAINIVFLYGLKTHPNFLTAKDSEGMYNFLFSDYMQLCFVPMIYFIVPYIIAIVQNKQRIWNIIGIVLNIIIGCCFIVYAKDLFDLYR